MTVLKIAAIGFDSWELTFLKTTVDLAAGIEIGWWRYVDDQETADVVLVNVESCGGRTRIDSHSSSDLELGQRIVTCSESAKVASSTTASLARPLTYPALVELLKKLQLESVGIPKKPKKHEIPTLTEVVEVGTIERGALTTAIEEHEGTEQLATMGSASGPTELDETLTCGDEQVLFGHQNTHRGIDLTDGDTERVLEDSGEEAEQIQDFSESVVPVAGEETGPTVEGNHKDMRDKDRPARKFYEVARFLGIVKGIIASGQISEISHDRFAPVWIYPEKGIYATPFDAWLIPEMFRTLASEFTVQTVGKGRLKEPLPKWETKPLWRLLYVAALYGSKGQLRENSHFHDRLRLIAKPDFNIAPDITDYREIARFMIGHTADLYTVAVESGVKIETIIDFCNACEEVSLIERGPSVSQVEIAGTEHGSIAGIASAGEQETEVDDPEKNHRFLRRFQLLFKRPA